VIRLKRKDRKTYRELHACAYRAWCGEVGRKVETGRLQQRFLPIDACVRVYVRACVCDEQRLSNASRFCYHKRMSHRTYRDAWDWARTRSCCTFFSMNPKPLRPPATNDSARAGKRKRENESPPLLLLRRPPLSVNEKRRRIGRADHCSLINERCGGGFCRFTTAMRSWSTVFLPDAFVHREMSYASSSKVPPAKPNIVRACARFRRAPCTPSL
jgi:hypothetical protein